MAVRLVTRQLHPLSARQYEVLMLYGDGSTYSQIAAALGLRYHTVKRHCEETRAKLGVSSLAEAYRLVRRMTREH